MEGVRRSWHRTRALELLEVDDPSDTVLIDNLRVNIDGWVTAGGKGYLFVDDDAFADDVAYGKVPGFEARDLVIGGHQGHAGK